MQLGPAVETAAATQQRHQTNKAGTTTRCRGFRAPYFEKRIQFSNGIGQRDFDHKSAFQAACDNSIRVLRVCSLHITNISLKDTARPPPRYHTSRHLTESVRTRYQPTSHKHTPSLSHPIVVTHPSCGGARAWCLSPGVR